GIGTVAVHDRGGAIVSTGVRGNAYDRLDVWMGYGDNGLQRALHWGKRTVAVTVHGIDPGIQENIMLENYSEDEKNSYGGSTVYTAPVENPVQLLFNGDLAYGSRGEDVARLQEILKNLNYYEGEITSVFDSATHTAVTKFQVSENIVPHESAFGAGYVGQRTTRVLSSKAAVPVAHAKSEGLTLIETFENDLKLGDSGADVRLLQEELSRINLLGIESTGYYGEVTQHAVFKFQQSTKLAGDLGSVGAGIFGPKTRAALNAIVAARLRTETMLAESESSNS
ncbi:MAG TPA: peptidoglycan-binding protein, partial [Candidatus Gracilibacteria bacterium]|nr:peptidoglycan-binding protein [Candidatus Gracilibacteria bacterium]